MKFTFDNLELVGEESGDVICNCKICFFERDAMPIIHYADPDNTEYADSDVILVTTVPQLTSAMAKHIAAHNEKGY
jgi:hypothetical protein